MPKNLLSGCSLIRSNTVSELFTTMFETVIQPTAAGVVAHRWPMWTRRPLLVAMSRGRSPAGLGAWSAMKSPALIIRQAVITGR